MSKESKKAAFAKCAKLNRNGKTHTVKKNPKSGMFSCVKMTVKNAQEQAKNEQSKTPPKAKTPFPQEN